MGARYEIKSKLAGANEHITPVETASMVDLAGVSPGPLYFTVWRTSIS
jgi:hypothetical protein